MAQVTIDTVQYPAWWSGATTVTIQLLDNSTITKSRADMEMLPQGIAVNDSSVKTFSPWSYIKAVDKAS